MDPRGASSFNKCVVCRANDHGWSDRCVPTAHAFCCGERASEEARCVAKRQKYSRKVPSLARICVKRFLILALRQDPHIGLGQCLEGAQKAIGLGLQFDDPLAEQLTAEYWEMCEAKAAVMDCMAYYNAVHLSKTLHCTCGGGAFGHWETRCVTLLTPY